MTTSCLFSGANYAAEAHVEEASQACLIPKTAFEEKMGASAEFRNLVFTSFSDRLALMMSKIEDIACTPIDVRLAACAIERAADGSHVEITHDQLAAELGTAREVVSRKLAQWEASGIVRRKRGAFEILDKASLVRLAAMNGPASHQQ